MCAVKPCKDVGAEEVSRKAIELGFRKENEPEYSCTVARKDGACTAQPELAREFCPKTCNLCHALEPWTWCKNSGLFCLASQSWCDSNTRCGKPVKNASECRTAAAELGFNSSVIELDTPWGPHGCFQAIEAAEQSQLYYNNNGMNRNSINVKALCSKHTPTKGEGSGDGSQCRRRSNKILPHVSACAVGCSCAHAVQSLHSLRLRMRCSAYVVKCKDCLSTRLISRTLKWRSGNLFTSA